MGVIKPYRYPHVWVSVWGLAIAVVITLSLVPSPSLPSLPSGGDKLEHLLAYALLAAGAVQLFRTRAGCVYAGLGLVVMGVLLEFAQGAYTRDRMQDPWDALANSIGVLLGMSLLLTPLRDLGLRWERWWLGSGAR